MGVAATAALYAAGELVVALGEVIFREFIGSACGMCSYCSHQGHILSPTEFPERPPSPKSRRRRYRVQLEYRTPPHSVEEETKLIKLLSFASRF